MSARFVGWLLGLALFVWAPDVLAQMPQHASGTLFSRVEGDYFTILGLPLLPLLGFLRDRGVLVP